MRLLKEILNFFLTYFLRPAVYRLFVIRWEIFRNPPFYFNYYGYKLFYRPRNGLVYHIGSMGSFESDVINCSLSLIQKEATVFDVGANIGLITIPIARKIKNVNIHCFEPSPYPYKYLKMTINKNRLNRKIRLNKLGLYNKSGKLNFYLHGDKNASIDGLQNTTKKIKSEKIKINATTIDEYVKKNNIKKIDLIKIDTEGSELLILQGAIKSISKFKPSIILEIWPQNLKEYGFTANKVFNYIKRLDYSLYSINKKLLDKKSLIKSTEYQGNYLALPNNLRCFICQSKYIKFICRFFRGGDIYECENCKNAFTNPYPDFSYNQTEKYLFKQGDYREALSYAKPQLNFIKKFASSGSFLDVGSGIGALVDTAGKSGFTAQGLEPSDPAVKLSRNNGLKIKQGC